MSEIEYEAPGDPRIDEDYRRISPMCFVAFGVGLLGLISIINVDMAAISILAIVLAAGVVIRVSSSGERVVGLGLAYLGILLPLVGLSAGFSYKQTREEFVTKKAIEFASEWLELVRSGEIHRPYELTLRYPDRQLPSVDLQAYYENLSSDFAAPKNNRRFLSYLKVEPEASLRREGASAKIEFEKVVLVYPIFRGARIRLQYRLVFPSTGEERRIIIEMKRDDYLPPTGVQWTVSNLFNTEPEIPRQLEEGGAM